MSHPFFSIIIPTYNRERLILDSINSILRQQNVSVEVIIVDDGSTDNTEQLVKGLNNPGVKCIKTSNRERGAARNSGALIARGEYINYFDSDDILKPCLSDLHLFIGENNFPGIVFGLIENITENGNVLGIVKPAYPDFKKSFLHNNFLACGSVFIKRELALTNLFSEDRRLSGTEDWELWLRLYAAHDFTPFPKVIFQQRHHDQRSLAKVPAARVIERESVFIDHINKNRKLLSQRFTASEIDLLVADRYTLMALSRFVSAAKKPAFHYLFKSLQTSPAVIRRKRFWALLKKLIVD